MHLHMTLYCVTVVHIYMYVYIYIYSYMFPLDQRVMQSSRLFIRYIMPSKIEVPICLNMRLPHKISPVSSRPPKTLHPGMPMILGSSIFHHLLQNPQGQGRGEWPC